MRIRNLLAIPLWHFATTTVVQNWFLYRTWTRRSMILLATGIRNEFNEERSPYK